MNRIHFSKCGEFVLEHRAYNNDDGAAVKPTGLWYSCEGSDHYG